jgi:hypothetical protein
MPSRRGLNDADDYDDEPRARRSGGRSRGRKPHGLSGGMWAAIIGALTIGVLVVVAAVVLARRGGSGGSPDGAPGEAGLFGGRPTGPPIDSAGFTKISKRDTIALESRYGPATRLSDADLERIGFTGPSPVDRRLRVRKSFRQSIAEFGVTNPEVYHWQWATTDLYIVLKPNDPKRNLLLKVYIHSGPDENGNHHNEMRFEDFGGEKD